MKCRDRGYPPKLRHCTPEDPCDEGEGGCDGDESCKGDLVCGKSSYQEKEDCCQKPGGTESVVGVVTLRSFIEQLEK